MTEAVVKTAAKTIFATAHAWYFMPVPTGYGRRGIPDIIACVPRIITESMIGQRIGLFAGVECKALHDMEPTKWQTKELAGIAAAGGLTAKIGAPTHEADLYELIRKHGLPG